MKKILLLISVGLLVGGYLVLLAYTNNAYQVEFNEATAETLTYLKENLEETKENILEGLLYNEVELPFDSQSSTYFLPLSMDNSLWETGEISVSDKDAEIFFIDSIHGTDKLTAIAENKAYSFVACKGGRYKYYNLLVTGLPVVSVNTNEDYSVVMLEDRGLSEELQAGSCDKVYSMTLYDTVKDSDWIQDTMVVLKPRGLVSSTFPKQSFKMNLLEPVVEEDKQLVKKDLSLLGMREDDDWILYAMYSDSSKIRDKLSIDIWNELCAENNPYEKKFGTDFTYVELFIDDEYYGLYGLMQPVDKKQLAIDDNSNEELYKRDIPTGFDLSFFETESGDIIRGGFELRGSREEVSLEDWIPLRELMDVYLKSDEDFIRYVPDIVDMNNVLEVWLYLQVVSGMDNRAKNMYFASKSNGSGNTMYFIPWDLDLTWGDFHDPDAYLYNGFFPELVTEYIGWEIGDRILQLNVQGAREALLEKWDIWRNTILSDEALEERIEGLQNQVINSGAFFRDRKRWPLGKYNKEADNLKEYAAERMRYLDESLSSYIEFTTE